MADIQIRREMYATIDKVAIAVLGLAIAAIVAFSIMFGILAGSIVAAFSFPIAIFSMAGEGDTWGVSIVGSFAVAIIWFAMRRSGVLK